MTQLQKWIKINQLYDESCPSWIRFKLIMDKNMISTVLYSLYVISPPLIGLLLLSSTNFYLWMLLIYIIYLQLLIFLNDRMLYPAFKIHDLMDLPINKRANYLHYIRFKSECKKAGMAKENIQKLLDWHKASNTKVNTHKFISSIKLLSSGFISLLLNHYQPEITQQISSNKPLALLILTGLVYVIIYLIDDISSIYKRREQKLSKFLRMFLKEED